MKVGDKLMYKRTDTNNSSIKHFIYGHYYEILEINDLVKISGLLWDIKYDLDIDTGRCIGGWDYLYDSFYTNYELRKKKLDSL